jgi:Cd2+/Zn2+-exporting ATPase
VAGELDESTPARLQRLTMSALEEKPRLRRWLDTFSDAYSKVVLAVAVAMLVGLPLLGVPLTSTATTVGAFPRALGWLIAAAPCALTVTPLAYVVRASPALTATMYCSSSKLSSTIPCKEPWHA